MVKVEFRWEDVQELRPNLSEAKCREIFSLADRELEEAMIGIF